MLYDYLLETFGKNEPIFLSLKRLVRMNRYSFRIFVIRITLISGSKKSLPSSVTAARSFATKEVSTISLSKHRLETVF